MIAWLIHRSSDRACRHGLSGGMRIAATVLLGGGYAATALGQQDAQKDVELEELVVTAPHYVPDANRSATKADVPLLETPQAVSVITRDQIDVLSWQNLEQSVRYSAGTVGENFGADERYDWITVRGYAPAQFIDGLQAAVNPGLTSGIDLYGFESVEVLKGPSSALYGKAPPGGLVNLTSRRPQPEQRGEIQLQYGSHEHKQGAFDATGALGGGETFLYRLTGLHRDRQTQVDRVGSERTFVAPAFTYNIADTTAFTFLGHYQSDDGEHSIQYLPAEGLVLPNPNGSVPVNRYVSDPNFDHFEREQYDAGYELEHAFTDGVSFHQGAKYARVKAGTIAIFGFGLQEDLRTLNRATIDTDEETSMVAVDSRLQMEFASGALQHTLLAGLDYRTVDSETSFGFGFGPPLDIFAPVYGQQVPAAMMLSHTDESQEQVGLYLQDLVRLDRWVFTASARHDRVDTTVKDLLYGSPDAGQKDAEFSYRAGVNYVFDSGLSPYVAYSRSFFPVLGADVAGNAFEPTRGRQYEAGLKFEPRRAPRGVRSFMSLAVFDLMQENALTQDPDNLFFSVQSGEVEVRGVELEAVARLYERLSMNASYSHTDSEVTRSNGENLGKQVPMVPENKVSFFVDYTMQTGALAGLGAGIGVRYLSESFGDDANLWRNESTTLVDATVHYDRPNWRFALNGNNVLDDEYVARCSNAFSCFYGATRTVVATATRKW